MDRSLGLEERLQERPNTVPVPPVGSRQCSFLPSDWNLGVQVSVIRCCGHPHG